MVMVQLLAVIFGVLLIAVPATAQIYRNQANAVVSPFNKVIQRTNAVYANTAYPGDEENSKSQALRYRQMTEPMNDANERHFITILNEIK